MTFHSEIIWFLKHQKKKMKKIISITAMLIFLVTAFVACNNQSTKKDQAETTTQTLASDEMYTCEMHPEVMSDKPGKCPKCGMDLEKKKMTDAQMKMMKEGTYTKPKE